MATPNPPHIKKLCCKKKVKVKRTKMVWFPNNIQNTQNIPLFTSFPYVEF